jgi:hypothetical protein
MDYVVIAGVKPWDGRYELDLLDNELTIREWGWVKRLSGYMPLTIMQGLDGADPELYTALAVIALRRAGKLDNAQVPDTYERMIDNPAGRITLESDPEPAEGADQDLPPAGSSNGNGTSSGDGSQTSSGSLDDPTLPATGTADSATSVSARPTPVT